VDCTTPEAEHLKLLLAFTQEMCHSLGLSDLHAAEYNLQEGQAFDAQVRCGM
jgi:hypothetical protein